MPPEHSLPLALLIGLLSAVHCVGMCGGIVTALSLSLPAEIRARRPRLLAYVALYNLGRVASYTLAGALAGGLGSLLWRQFGPGLGFGLQLVAGLVLVAMGLYLAGWFPRLAVLEGAGGRIWRRLQPLGRGLMPVNTPARALAFGALWGWLPCGLVYAMLAWSAAAGSALAGAGYMLAFGLGTVVPVAAAGVLAATVTVVLQRAGVRRAAGVLVIAMGLAALWGATGHGHDHGTAPGDDQEPAAVHRHHH